MPPLPLLPRQPPGVPDYYPTPGSSFAPAATPAAASDPYAEVRKWQEKLAELTERALTEQNAFNKLQLQQQREDAEKALKNAYRIAELSSQTSRYGIDVNSRNELARLQENQRQFDLNHGLDQQKLGLDYAKAYTDYASGPDTLFMLNDFKEGLNRASQGFGPSGYGAQGAPNPRDWTQFAALSGFGNMTGIGNPGAAASGGGQGSGASAVDPRVKAAKGIIDAIGPSDGTGHDADNFAALNAIESVFRASKPGSYERLRPGQQKAFAAGLNRLGYYAPDAISDMQRNGIGQGSSRSY